MEWNVRKTTVEPLIARPAFQSPKIIGVYSVKDKAMPQKPSCLFELTWTWMQGFHYLTHLYSIKPAGNPAIPVFPWLWNMPAYSTVHRHCLTASVGPWSYVD